MKAASLALALIALAFPRAYAADVFYLGLDRDRALLRDSNGREYRLKVGDLFSDLGKLISVDDREAVFEVRVSEEERESLRARRLFVPDIRRARIARQPD